MDRIGRTLVCLALLLFGSHAAGIRAETVVYYHTDALGSPVAVTDASRNVIERTQYAPYGDTLNRPLHDGPGYTGHETDAATGLVYAQQRYYDPVLGRFLSADPVAASGSSGANFNRFRYANDNPYRYYDPDGRCTGSHIEDSNGNCASTGTTTTMVTAASVTAVRAFNSGRTTYIQYADGAVERRTGSRPWRDNNPGDLRRGSKNAASTRLALGWDYSPTGPNDRVTEKQPFAIFSSIGVGDRALENTLLSVYGNDTIGQAIQRFAPSSDSNDPRSYASFIMKHTGVSASATINSLTPSQLRGAIEAIKAKEGFNNGGAAEIYNFGLGAFSQ
ncbi:hypothetical protein MBSD_n2495 [Mizugakiibacter sediminis]|uniref:Teneurin-like YD-shell domain-containing protein n=1 Tax=Mizugakiibacter sediminis TaxID=1475481 RepID=A0A0K8QQL1_9GAMM|nr:RHS repeat-associated core domain-containing protein [Mizugakiibacter sediminis]GAP67179.1 hypothetical protein MBSD_n2495 [Mizugakiibacter sediminis]